MHIGQLSSADGCWKISAFGFTREPFSSGYEIRELAEYLAKDVQSAITRYSPLAWDVGAVIDLRAVFQASYEAVDIRQAPTLLLPAKGDFGLTVYDKIFCSEGLASESI